MRHSVFPSPWMGVAAGGLLLYGAIWCFEDAWEGRGRRRPRFARILPG